MNRPFVLFVLILLVLTCIASLSWAQEVTIPDPNLNAAIRETLGKPAGPLTQQDMLGLTNFTALSRNITNLQGLETARNLTALTLDDNHITDIFFPAVLTNMTALSVLDLSENPITNLTLPNALTNLVKFRLENGRLAQLTLPPAGMSRLTNLSVGFNQLTNLTLPADMTNLSILSAFQNQLTNVTLPAKLAKLDQLNLDGNHFTSLALPTGMAKLSSLIASGNQLTSFIVPADMTNLNFLRLSDNQLTSFTLPPSLVNLNGLFLQSNQLTNVSLPAGLNHLTILDLSGNNLPGIKLPPGLSTLSFLNFSENQLTNITLPPDMQQLVGLFFGDNPLTSLVLSEPLAATGMASVVASLQNQNIPVYIYPLTVQLVNALPLPGDFKFGITGPPGIYTLYRSTNFATWSLLSVVTNPLGAINFHDVTLQTAPQKFYRAQLQVPPTNMIFIPPNTFTMGTPANEVNRHADEGPQTTVTLTRGFWIGKYEVTQREYQAVVGSNPSGFPGDLDRPVESVSFLDATNYCGLLTQQELAAGRIPPGSHYRLPTEAEWECAARAGTTTRFSYGDDPDFSQLADNAWYWFNSGFGTHPVGQKAPNQWGLYDMEGNVIEWTLDWYGAYPGGSVTDPQGPASNVQGVKVIRGGAWDAGESDCRSGRRLTEGVSPFITDFILGFRVVLVTGP